MTTRRTASLPSTSPKVAEKNGGQGRGQPVAAGSGSWQMLSAAPRRPGQGDDAWCGVFMTDLAPRCFARSLKGHHAGPRRPARLRGGRTSPFLKVMSLAALDVGSRKALLALRDPLTLKWPGCFLLAPENTLQPSSSSKTHLNFSDGSYLLSKLDSALCSLKKNFKSFSPLLEVVYANWHSLSRGQCDGYIRRLTCSYYSYIYFY